MKHLRRCIVVLAICAACSALANSWVITDHVEGTVRRQSFDGQTLQVFDLAGNLVQTTPIVIPYLYSLGSLILPRPTNENVYLSRGESNAVAISANPAAASTLPGLLELDGKWYGITQVGFIQGIYTLGEFSISGGSYSNCRLSNGQALPSPGQVRLVLANNSGSQTVNLASNEKIIIQFVTGADTIRVKSATGNVICNGEVPSPFPVLDPIFRAGFE